MAAPRVILSSVTMAMHGLPEKQVKITSADVNSNSNNMQWRYHKKSGVAISINLVKYDLERFFYRGRPFSVQSNFHISFPFCFMQVNVLGGSAEKWLELDKTIALLESQHELKGAVLDALGDILSSNEFKVESGLITLSLFKKWVARLTSNHSITDDKAWEVHNLGNGTTIAEALALDKIYFTRELRESYWSILKEDGNEISDKEHINTDLWLNFMIPEWMKNNQGRIYPIGEYKLVDKPIMIPEKKFSFFPFDFENKNVGFVCKLTYALSRTPLLPEVIHAAISVGLISISYLQSGRFLVAAKDLEEWSCLALKDHRKALAHHLFSLTNRDEDFILLPFWVKKNGVHCTISTDIIELEEFYKWIERNLKNPMSIEEIREKYQKLIKFLDDLMLARKFGERWAVARNLPMPSEPSASTLATPTNPTQQ